MELRKLLLVWLPSFVVFLVADDFLLGIGVDPTLRFHLLILSVVIAVTWSVVAVSKAATAMRHPLRAMNEVFGGPNKRQQSNGVDRIPSAPHEASVVPSAHPTTEPLEAEPK